MQTLIVSTCGTSLLTNLAGEDRGLVTRHANARSPADVLTPDRTKLESLTRRMTQRLRTAGKADLGRLSAELNGLLKHYGGQLDRGGDTHWLIATDTWLGNATASALAEVLNNAHHIARVWRIKDLRTSNLMEFHIAMTEIARLCAREVRGMRDGGFRVLFNLTGGFKSVQGFMQALGMLYADESLYLFEGTDELLRLPRLPIELNTAALVREHEWVFRRLAAGLPVSATEARNVPDTLLMELDGQVALSVWGDVVWEEAGPTMLSEQLWPALDPRLRFDKRIERDARNFSRDERRQINERLAELARLLHDGHTNLARLDLKKLNAPHGDSTHECDAFGGKRLFGHFDHDVFVVDKIAEGLH